MTRALKGSWYNQHGSELRLEVADNGKLSGTFHSGVGILPASDVREITGFVAGDLVTFSVSFGDQRSLTAWTGHHVAEGEEALHMMWHMSVSVPGRNAEQDLWKGVWTGNDVFRRVRPQQKLPGQLPSHALVRSQ